MANAQRLDRSSLKSWEDWLEPQVRQVELLGEIPIATAECGQLGQAFKQRLKTMGLTEAVRIIRKSYPRAFAIYLVAEGIYGYQGGDYWSQVCEVTGLPPGNTWRWGQLFENIVEDLGLPMFDDMREEAHRYVSLILAHGGVPDYCLPDFFKNMLQPSVLRAKYADLSAAEMIEEWQWRSSVQYFTDKPVIRFLAYGGRLAEDFVERCREMALEYVDSGLMPDAEDLGLPERVADAYRQWVSEQTTEIIQRERGEKWRLRKPEIVVQQWGEGVLLDLPPQQAPATQARAGVAWRIKLGGQEQPLPVRVRKTGFDWKTTAESLPLRQPAEIYEVSLLVDGQVKSTWRYQGFSDKHPLLVFDMERGTLLKPSYSLPARRLGLLYPADCQLQIEGEASMVEKWRRLPWSWADFQGQTWDLEGATRLTLVKNKEPKLTVMLRPDEARQRPHLEEGDLFAAEKPGVRAPVYVGAPPHVRIPLTARRSVDEELARWRITVQNRWPAVPEFNRTATLAGLHPQLHIGPDYVDVLLHDRSLLGEAPFGSYLVRLRGPLGRDAEFTLRMVPRLTILGHEQLYLPDPESGPPPATLLVDTLPGTMLECQVEDGECQVESTGQHKDRWEYQVQVGATVTEVDLTLVGPRAGGEPVRVPVSVPIRRLRWAFDDEQAIGQRREWTGSLISFPVDGLLQSRSPSLVVDIPTGQQSEIRLALRLMDIDGAELQATKPLALPAGSSLLRFDLAAFRDTIRASRSPVLRFELEGRGLSDEKGIRRWPVLSLSQAFVVQDVTLQAHRAGNRAVFELHWHEAVRLRNRHIRFWPLWRPWDPYFEQAIDDSADEKCEFEAPAEFLRSGKYRLEFLVVDPWAPQTTEKPVKGAPGTVDRDLISAEAQLRHIADRLQDKGEYFELCLERAIVCLDMGKPDWARSSWQWCYEHLDGGTVPQVLTLLDIASAATDAATVKGLQIKMFSAGRMARLLQAREQGEISPEQFQTYMSNLPKPDLLPQQTCEYLLEIGDEVVQLRAAEALIVRANSRGPDAVLRWVEGARLSHADALVLLGRNVDFSIGYLEKRITNPAALALLKLLSQDLGERSPIVPVGSWVFCDAGWARVVRIEDRTGQPIGQFIRGQTEFLLYATLRPSHDKSPIVIDLAKRTISFPTAESLYTCTKCDRFSEQDKHKLLHHHNDEVHRHTGWKGPDGAALRPVQANWLKLSSVEYSTRAPRSQLGLSPSSDRASKAQ